MNSNSSDNNISRRDFLSLATKFILAITSFVGLGAIFRFLEYQPLSTQQVEFDLGSTENYPIGTRTLIPEAQAILIHDEDGFTALSLVCTHLGCIVNNNPNGFSCPCHGSQFSLYGELVKGPAKKPLTQLRVEITDDKQLIIYIV
jgi:cytochrome b6-f complex iron-sulfur subunit